MPAGAEFSLSGEDFGMEEVFSKRRDRRKREKLS
jgi:hypothetical protein